MILSCELHEWHVVLHRKSGRLEAAGSGDGKRNSCKVGFRGDGLDPYGSPNLCRYLKLKLLSALQFPFPATRRLL